MCPSLAPPFRRSHGPRKSRGVRQLLPVGCDPLMEDTGLIGQFRPHAGHIKELLPQSGLRNIFCQDPTLRREAHAHERIFADVELRDSTPPLGRERLHLSVVGWPIDGADDGV